MDLMKISDCIVLYSIAYWSAQHLNKIEADCGVEYGEFDKWIYKLK